MASNGCDMSSGACNISQPSPVKLKFDCQRERVALTASGCLPEGLASAPNGISVPSSRHTPFANQRRSRSCRAL
jgi:hypothetical protein